MINYVWAAFSYFYFDLSLFWFHYLSLSSHLFFSFSFVPSFFYLLTLLILILIFLHTSLTWSSLWGFKATFTRDIRVTCTERLSLHSSTSFWSYFFVRRPRSASHEPWHWLARSHWTHSATQFRVERREGEREKERKRHIQRKKYSVRISERKRHRQRKNRDVNKRER